MPSWPVGQPTKQFLKDLADYDPGLRVRWSHKHGYWRIERRLFHGASAVYDMTDPDDRTARSEFYQVAVRVPYDCLGPQVFRHLDTFDLQKKGGYKRTAREMEEAELEAQRRQRERSLDEMDQRSKARWTSWNTNYPLTKYGRSYDHRAPGGRG